MNRKTLVTIAVLWMVAVAALASSALTLYLTRNASDNAQENAGFARLHEVYDILTEEYYQPLDGDALILGAIQGMTDAVHDPYTFYYTTEAMTAHEENSEGVYYGLGMIVSLHEEGGLEIRRVYDDSPASRAGLAANDRILAIDGRDISGMELSDACALMQNENHAAVVLDIVRGDTQLQITATPDKINKEYAEYQLLDGHIGYISIEQFTGNSVECVRKGIKALQAANADCVIVDVRDNPGGLLDDAVEIADMFLPKSLIVYIENREGKRTEFFADADYWNVPVAVLTNGNSASASEIFAAAIRENRRGIVVGETTFGKGIVQDLVTFATDNAGMQFTSACYYTPDGNSIHGVGVTPDILVAADGTEDVQLQAAIDALTNNP